ncbi:hypothetical protein ACFLIM_17415 [Nonomuraea sp. M3C6]|uniref:Methyltransferase domain-containing protein n=1 Tax=Nonomuraea marmarensis TaxID=3351344 RepID=A0ABW7ACX1_9ACTN
MNRDEDIRMTLDGYYDEVAPLYDSVRLDREEEIHLTVSRVRSHLLPDDIVLDIGSGTARYAAALRELGLNVLALDRRFGVLK